MVELNLTNMYDAVANGRNNAQVRQSNTLVNEAARLKNEQAPARNRLLDLQNKRTQQQIDFAPQQEQRAKDQLAVQQQAGNLDQAGFNQETLIKVLPLMNAQAKRLRQIPPGEARIQAAQQSAAMLQQFGLPMDDFNPLQATDQNLDAIIADTDAILQKSQEGNFTSAQSGINPDTGKNEYFQTDSDGIVKFTGVEVPRSAADKNLEAKQIEAANKKAERTALEKRDAAITSMDITRALDQSDGIFSTGFTGAITSAVPGTPAHDLKMTLQTVRSNIGFNKLQAMRNASPTGGALGNVSDTENKLLQSVMGATEQSQSKEQLQYNLNRLNVIFDSVVNGTMAIPLTQENFDELPAGAAYIDPDLGVPMRKP